MNEDNKEKKTHLISRNSFIWMLILAIICDVISFLLSLIPIIGAVLNPIFSFTVDMGIWFWTAMHGLGWRGAAAGGAGMVIEIIPVLGALPTFTAEVIALYISSRVQEKVPLVGAIAGGKMDVKSIAGRTVGYERQQRELNRNKELTYQE